MMMGNTSFFRVVHRFTVSEDTARYTFKHDGAGCYVFCEEPPLTVEKAISDSRENQALLNGGGVIYKSSGSYAGRQSTSLTYVTSGNHYDYWGSYFTVDGDNLTIGGAGSNDTVGKFKAGKKYVVLKLDA